MKRIFVVPFILLFALVSDISQAETYRCVKGGQTVYSDLPCASGASRVDASSDSVSREQRRQAETVDIKNRRQLSELEYQSSRERNFRGGVAILPNPASSPPVASRRSR